jgi:hypothetical protein
MDIDLNPDGPHSPERTAEAAGIFDACSRYLVYATMGSAPGLDYPAEMYALLGELYSATGRMQQMTGQLAAWLRREQEAGKLGDRRGKDTGVAVGDAAYALNQAGFQSASLTRWLQKAQDAIAGLHAREGGTEPGHPTSTRGRTGP